MGITTSYTGMRLKSYNIAMYLKMEEITLLLSFWPEYPRKTNPYTILYHERYPENEDQA